MWEWDGSIDAAELDDEQAGGGKGRNMMGQMGKAGKIILVAVRVSPVY